MINDKKRKQPGKKRKPFWLHGEKLQKNLFVQKSGDAFFGLKLSHGAR